MPHVSRLPRSLDAALRRIAEAEQMSRAALERAWLQSMVALYDAERVPSPQ